MGLLRNVARKTYRVVRKPGLWLTVFVLAAVVGGSLALARIVIAPTILASNEFTIPVPVRTYAPQTGAGAADLGRSSANESPVQIMLVSAEKQKPRRKRSRNRRRQSERKQIEQRKTPDVVFRAPTEVPSFADPLPANPPVEPPTDPAGPDDGTL